ncbi:pyridoxal phosphate-dependent aminotransferase [bacterium]|nr:pyridoxal phosphate-dependent aminotransferase [bacterium]
MISRRMQKMVAGNSVIRAMFEEGLKMARQYGPENVFDFSLGNPNVPAPEEFKNAIVKILQDVPPVKVHGYMPNTGFPSVREKIASSLNKRFGTSFTSENIIMTVGAAGGLNIILKTLLNPGDEVITFAPFFGEYRNYVANFEGELVVVPPNTINFQPDLAAFEKLIRPQTKAVIINSPNNPTGVVYSEETIKRLSSILEEKQKEFSSSIYLISDEPYRELVYGGVTVPYLTKYYRNTLVGYSYSKSLSIPGERLGYVAVPSEIDDYEQVWSALAVANRILGFVNAPSLAQLAVAECLDAKTDIAYYGRNRDALYEGLCKLNFKCVKPEGAFYLFMKTPVEDDNAFAQAAKKFNILVVPGSAFGCPGYVRIAYCVSYETIVNSLPKFAELAASYGL